MDTSYKDSLAILSAQQEKTEMTGRAATSPSDNVKEKQTKRSSSCGAATAQETKMGIVHLFGGVFVGAVAEEMQEMCRNWTAVVSSSSAGINLAATATATTAATPGVIVGDGQCSSSSGVDEGSSNASLSPVSQLYSDDTFPAKDEAGNGGRQQAPGTGAQPGLETRLGADGTKGGLKRKLAEALEQPPADATAPLAQDRQDGDSEMRTIVAVKDCTRFVSECNLPTSRGMFRMRAYRYSSKRKSHEPVVMVCGNLRDRENVPVRVHDQCQTSEVFGSKRCDCREQLDLSLRYVQEKGGGAVIYLAQEGRGIGLANKVAAYAFQDGGLDTVDANRRLGFKDDERSYDCVGFILRDMGIKSIQLMTNNPRKIERLKALGVEVKGRIPIQVPPNEHNHGYLEAKVNRMSHLINNL